MPAVLYLNAIPRADIKAYEHHIEALAQGELLPGAKQEKLKTSAPIYSIRVNDQQRIIYARYVYCGEQHILVLDIDKNHKYDHAFLKKNYFRNFIRANLEVLNREIEQLKEIQKKPEDGAGSASIRQQNKRNHFTAVQLYDGEIFEPDDAQQNVKERSVVQGGPGTGKTSVALSYVERGAQQGKKVVFTSQSTQLVEHVRQSWLESPAYDAENKNIELLTYDALLLKFNGNNQFIGNARPQFNVWFAAYFKKQKKKEADLNEEAVYQEFRIRSGYSEADYLDEAIAGKKQTSFQNDKRKWIATAYNSWMQYCNAEQLRFAEFHELAPLEEDDKADLIVVDEAHDFSHLQLDQIAKLAKNKNVIFFIDSRQSLRDSKSKVIYLQKLLGEKGHYIALETSYRSAPNIMRFAVAVSNLKKSLMPSKEKSASTINIPEANQGEVAWHEVSKNSIDEIIKAYGKNKDVCVITDKKNKALFIDKGFSRVFTAEEIKGLQYKRAVLFRVMEHEDFTNINGVITADGNIDSNKQSLLFTTPLNNLFVSITRAREHLDIYHETSRNAEKLVKLLLGSCQINRHAKLAKVRETSKEGWLYAAEKLYRNGNLEQAQLTLQNDAGLSESEIAAQFLQWNPEQPPADNLATNNNANIERTDRAPPTAGDIMTQLLTHAGTTDNEMRKIQADTLASKIKRLNQILAKNDITAIWRAMNPDTRDDEDIDWSYASPDNKTALSVACSNNNKKLQGKAKKIVSHIVNDSTIEISPQRDKKIFAFKEALLLKKNDIVIVFLASNRFDLSDYFDIIMQSSKSEKEIIVQSMAEIYSSSTDAYVREKIISNFINFFPRSFYFFMFACEMEKKEMQALEVLERLLFSGRLEGTHVFEVYKTLHNKLEKKSTPQNSNQYLVLFCYVHYFLIKDKHIDVAINKHKISKLVYNGSLLASLVLAKIDLIECPDRCIYANMLEVIAAKGFAPAVTELANVLREIYYLGSKEGRELANARPERIFTLYAQAASMSQDPYAYVQAGICCETGFGTEVNKIKAYYYYELAANQHYSPAIEHKGRCLRNGIGVDRSHEDAFKFYKTAAAKGSAVGQYFYGQCLEHGIGTEQDQSLAYHAYRDAIKINSLVVAIIALRRFYAYGIGAEVNKGEVERLGEFITIDNTCTDKDVALSTAYFPEKTTAHQQQETFYTRKFSSFLKTAQAYGIENDLAQFEVGHCYEYGIGVKRDLDLAFFWYKKSAENGNTDAMATLSYCYLYGSGVNKDENEYHSWHEKRKIVLRTHNTDDRLIIASRKLSAIIEKSDYKKLLYALSSPVNFSLPYNWNTVDPDHGLSVLSFMCMKCDDSIDRTAVISLLIRNKKVDINIIDNKGNCALVYLVILASNENLEKTLPLFLEHPSFDKAFIDSLREVPTAKRNMMAEKLTSLKVKMKLNTHANDAPCYAYQSKELDERLTDLIKFLKSTSRIEQNNAARAKQTA